MKDFTAVRRYTFYTEYGNGVQEDEPEGDSVDYQDYKELLEAYQELKFVLEGLDK